jgi:D-alanyl-D-alanine dipeptidase
VLVDGIEINERDRPVRLVTLTQTPRLFLNPLLADDWRIRPDIKSRLHAAADALPDDLCLMVYEAFRSRTRQQELWAPVHAGITAEHPDWTPQQIYHEAARWVSPPDGFGSGHQAGAAVDVTLATADGEPLDMGTGMQEFTPLTPTASIVSPDARGNRDLLVKTLKAQGLINYPDEWWHFCYGDRLWAEITGRTSAFFAPID